MAAHVEGDDLPFPRLLAFDCLVNRTRDAVRALRGGEEPFGLHELPSAFEDVPFILRIRDRIDEAAVPEQGEDRGAAVASQTAPVHRFHFRLVAEPGTLQEDT